MRISKSWGSLRGVLVGAIFLLLLFLLAPSLSLLSPSAAEIVVIIVSIVVFAIIGFISPTHENAAVEGAITGFLIGFAANLVSLFSSINRSPETPVYETILLLAFGLILFVMAGLVVGVVLRVLRNYYGKKRPQSN